MKKQDLRKAFSNPPEHFHNRVVMTLNNLTEEKGEYKMKRMTLKKGLVIAAMTILALSTTVYAAGKMTSQTTHSKIGGPEGKIFSTSQKNAADIGIEPQLVDSFSNGFTFYDTSVAVNKHFDENMNMIEKYESITLQYRKNSDIVVVVMSADSVSTQAEPNGVKSVYKDIELEYSSHISKSVPDDYLMTEQDKEDSKNGKVTFNKGGDIVKQETVQAVTWKKDNIRYNIVAMGESLDKQGVLEMAQEIIDAK